MGDHEAPHESLLDHIKGALHLDREAECAHDVPKLTAEEWTYVKAMTEGGQ